MHVPSFLPPESDHELLLMVDESVLRSLSGAVDKDVVIALYILSVAPMPLSSDWHVPITPLRLISLAYGFAQDIGLGYCLETARVDTNGIFETSRSRRITDSVEDQLLVRNDIRQGIRYNLIGRTAGCDRDTSSVVSASKIRRNHIAESQAAYTVLPPQTQPPVESDPHNCGRRAGTPAAAPISR